MWIAVIAVVLVAVGAVVAKVTWRPSADEAHSVRNYRTALGTMEHISDRTGRSTDTIPGHAGGWEDPAARTGSPSVHITGRDAADTVPSAPVPVPEAVPGFGPGRDPGEPFTAEGELAFDGARPDSRAAGGGRPVFKPVAPEFRSDRARKQAIHSMEHRQWHWRTPTVVIVVLRSEERRVGKECRCRCDWSSDVCSSDLGGPGVPLRPCPQTGHPFDGAPTVALEDAHRRHCGSGGVRSPGLRRKPSLEPSSHHQGQQIGRA